MILSQYKNLKFQQGVGLVEVLVALLLLAIGVVGFAALQVRAVTASSEAFQRSQAMVIARDMGERIRVNVGARSEYFLASNWALSTAPANCRQSNCTAAQLAQYDIVEIKTQASAVGANGSANMLTCSGNATLHCLYVAWGNTTPTNSTAANTTSCTLNGTFQPSSTCILLETY
jgi:type IV pilus assembly protein PilV